MAQIFYKKKMIGKNLRKIMQQLFLMFCAPKRNIYILLMFQNMTQLVKNESFF